MSRLSGGPADGVTLQLGRAPLLLRVVYDSQRDDFDALDQLADEAKFHEGLSAYVRVSDVTRMCLDYHDGRRRRGALLASADYRYLPQQPTDGQMRSNAAWQAWARWWAQANQSPATAGHEGAT